MTQLVSDYQRVWKKAISPGMVGVMVGVDDVFDGDHQLGLDELTDLGRLRGHERVNQ